MFPLEKDWHFLLSIFINLNVTKNQVGLNSQSEIYLSADQKVNWKLIRNFFMPEIN